MLLPTRRRSVTGLAQHVPAPFAPSNCWRARQDSRGQAHRERFRREVRQGTYTVHFATRATISTGAITPRPRLSIMLATFWAR